MPLPLLLIVPLIVSLAGYGVKKGYDAKSMFDRAKRIGSDAEDRHRRHIRLMEARREKLNLHLQELGRLKVAVYSDQIKHLVGIIRKLNKNVRSSLHGFDVAFSPEELMRIDCDVATSLELSSGLGSGAASGALMALGAYGSVGALGGLASTGTAIAGLSGAAASNATLAFLGGGALSAGGFGVAGGMAVLGGVVVAPALAITGFVLAGQAEKALTEASLYAADVDKSIAEIGKAQFVLDAIELNVAEQAAVIKHLASRYDANRTDDVDNFSQVQMLLTLGKGLKAVLEQQVMLVDGKANPNLSAKIGGYMEL